MKPIISDSQQPILFWHFLFRPYEIKFEPSYLIENSNKMEKMFFHQQKEDKEYIKYQYPEDRFAPIEELGVVCKFL